MSRESSDVLEMAAMIARDYLPGPWRHVTVNNIVLKKVTGGLSNWLYQMSLPPATTTSSNVPRTVLLRFHGQVNGESAFEHIVTESVVFTILSERKLGPKLFGIFPGGRVEEFIDARPLSVQDLKDPTLSMSIATKMAEVHQLVVPICKKPTWLFDLSAKYIESLMKAAQKFQPTDSRTRDIIDSLANYNLLDELDWLRQYLESLNSTVVFCHNDVNEGNILRPVNGSKTDLVLIDFEYCAYNYRAFDIANHFVECMLEYTTNEPYFEMDQSAYPSLAHQTRFVRKYLSTYRSEDRNEASVPDDEVQKLLHEVNNFRVAVHFFWALWAGANALSKIPFSYWEFFSVRFDTYLKLKEQAISFDVPGNKRKKV